MEETSSTVINSTMENLSDHRSSGDLYCGPEGSQEEIMAIGDTCSFWLEGVALSVVGVIGIVGNILTILVLSTKDMRNSFNLLLIVLAWFDIFFIIIAVLDYSVARVFEWPFDMESKLYVYMFPRFLYPINNIIFSTSIFLTVVVAFERFNAVCRPHQYRNNTASSSPVTRVASYVLPVILFSALLNIPKFFETELVTREVLVLHEPDSANEGNSTTGNLTQLNMTKMNMTTYIMTPLRNNPEYITYYVNWTRLLLTGIIPVSSLVYFNTRIFKGIKYAHVRANRNSKTNNEMNLAGVLIVIVIVFLLCHFPRLIINCTEFLWTNSIRMCESFMPPGWFLCLTSFMHWLLIVNASTNFLIYCFMGNKFKTVLMSMVRDLIKGKEQSSSLVMMADAVGVKRELSKATTLTVAVSPIPAREPEEVNLIVPPAITEEHSLSSCKSLVLGEGSRGSQSVTQV